MPAESPSIQLSHSALGQGARMCEVGDEEIRRLLTPFDITLNGVVGDDVNHRQAGDGYEWHQVRSNSAIAFRMLIW